MDSGLVDDLDKLIRLSFVTEGEASLHYCMFHANLAPSLLVSMGTCARRRILGIIRWLCAR